VRYARTNALKGHFLFERIARKYTKIHVDLCLLITFINTVVDWHREGFRFLAP
jgi:hypothetical protein